MERRQLATRLIASDASEREGLLRKYAPDADVELARELNALYQETRAGDPMLAAQAAACLDLLNHTVDQPEIAALAAWTGGMAAMHLESQIHRGVDLLDEAVQRFTALGRPLDVAATQVSMLQGLAMLGRYDEAIACGVAARDTFEASGDLLDAGKIEQNLGNIARRRGRFQEAERLYRSARERYTAVQHEPQLVQIDNCLGAVLLEELRFADAGAAFEQALDRAERIGLDMAQTETRYNLGCLALFQGRYDRALDHLEQVRRAYAELGFPHLAAPTELEMADAYLELNMATEAAAIASRLSQTFAELGMRAEQARALACHGRAVGLQGQSAEARRLLAEASDLYLAEGNTLEAASTTLVGAHLLYAEGAFEAAIDAVSRTEEPFARARTWGRLLLARWLHGEAARVLGRPEAQTLLETTLSDAHAREQSQIAYRCLTSLGKLAQSMGDLAAAQRAYEASVAIIEELRAPLPAEEFRTAFLSDKLTPFSELARLYLATGTERDAARAFEYVERARSRALVDMLAGIVNVHSRPRDAFEAELFAQLRHLREELQSYYSQINRADGSALRSPEAMEELYAAVREREAGVLDIRRRIEQRGGTWPGRSASLDVSRLQQALGHDAALVEYFSLDGKLLAFVVTDEHLEVFEDLGLESEVEAAVTRLRFQIDTLRFAGSSVRRHTQQLAERARHYLMGLYDTLLAPIERHLGDRRLVVVPHRALHYVPFHALHDGRDYLVQRRAVSYAPSAAVLLHCLHLPVRPVHHAVLVGVADEQIPRVRDEVRAIAEILPRSDVLLDADATAARVRELAPRADVLHLACHGQFRPDNPLFSSLHLGDGYMTVRDAYDLNLGSGLVTLSACETGMNAVAPGEELIGLARGFFSAGTASLLVSLWTVDDASTAELMAGVYAGLRDGLRPADALARSQRELIMRYGHPYYWSAFAVLGRW